MEVKNLFGNTEQITTRIAGLSNYLESRKT